MEIDMWPLDRRIQAKNLNLSNIGTNFNVDIKFEKDGKFHHLAQQVIDVAVYDEDLEDDRVSSVGYSRIHFNVRSTDLSDEEITDILVNVLANYRLYLYKFSITKRETAVSYKTPESESGKLGKLTYAPVYRRNTIYIDVEAQLEDDVNYYDLLDIKIKEPIREISGKRIKELGYEFQDYGIYSFAILDEEQAKEYLKLEDD